MITVLEPTPDSVKILDAPRETGNEIESPKYSVGETDSYYGAEYNNTAGYLGNVPSSSTWTSNQDIVVVTSPGYSSKITCSDTVGGTARVTLSTESGHQASVIIEILTPSVDTIRIQNDSSDGGELIENHTLALEETKTYYAVAYNDTAGSLGTVDVDWTSSNPSVGSISDSYAPQTIFSASSDSIGSTTISMIYNGNEIGSFVVTIIDNLPPTADAGSDQIILEGEILVFDGTDSDDNVEIDTYEWTFEEEGTQITLNGATPQYEFLVPGTYIITLEVIDTSGNSDSDTFSVTVEEISDEVEETDWSWLLILIFVIIAILLVFFFLSKKRKDKNICSVCGKPFYPKTEAEATSGTCQDCALKGALTPVVPSTSSEIEWEEEPAPEQQTTIPSSETESKEVSIKCPSCGGDFAVIPAAKGVNSVTCPQCNTTSHMEF
jgi:hypothetical protein